MRLLTIIITLLSFNSYSQKQINLQEVRVDLSGRHLKKVPDSIFQNLGITYLDLGSSSVTFYPPLSSLADNNSNDISFLSDKIGLLTNVKTLILNTNKLKTLPNSIEKLIHLEVLDLSINKDLEIIKQLDKLKKLQNLQILKIVDVKITKDEVKILKSSLNPNTKVITTVSEYFESLK